MNSIQSIKVSDNKLQTYLSENKLLLTFCILHYGLKSLRARYDILEDKILNFRSLSLNEYSPIEDLSEQISRRQVHHLDLLSNMFMFMEDFLGYSHNLRKAQDQFPKWIAPRNIKTVKKEVEILKSYKVKDVHQYLLFSDLDNLSLDSEEKNIVNQHQRKISESFLRSIRNILRFNAKYYRVYIKYKHIFNALLGFHSDRPDPRIKKVIISSQIYVRDFEKRFSTYLLPTTSLECVEYYQGIIGDIFSVFQILMVAHLSRMTNLGKPFVFPVVPIEDTSAAAHLEPIIAKINYNSNPFTPVDTKISFSEKLSANIIAKMRKEQIVRLRRDIFNYRMKQTNQKTPIP